MTGRTLDDDVGDDNDDDGDDDDDDISDVSESKCINLYSTRTGSLNDHDS